MENIFDVMKKSLIESALSEAQSLYSIWRAWADLGFGVISAFLPDKSQEQNMKRTEELKSEIRSAGWGYIPLEGRWKDIETGQIGKELSFFIPVPKEKTVDQLKDWIIKKGSEAKYDQQGIIIHDPKTGVKIINPKSNQVLFASTTFKPDQVADNYSILLRGRHKGRTFHFA